MATDEFDYIAVVQCHIVKQRCSGYHCEKAFTGRTGGFADLPAEKQYRTLYLDCGGCCGKALHRKLGQLTRQARKDDIGKDRIVVQLSSCITKDNYHSPRCPHAEYLRELIARVGLRVREDTVISEQSDQKRQDGTYKVTKPA